MKMIQNFLFLLSIGYSIQAYAIATENDCLVELDSPENRHVLVQRVYDESTGLTKALYVLNEFDSLDSCLGQYENFQLPKGPFTKRYVCMASNNVSQNFLLVNRWINTSTGTAEHLEVIGEWDQEQSCLDKANSLNEKK